MSVAAEAGHDQEFEIEGIALLDHRRQDVLEDVTADELDSGLSVANVETEQQTDQLLIAPRIQPTRRWVDHLGGPVTLASEDDVGMVGADDLDEFPEKLGRDVPVSVDESEVPAATAFESGADGLTLAPACGQHDTGDDVGSDVVESPIAAVGGTIGNSDDLERGPRGTQHLDGALDRGT